jgi:carbon monoxide dehydrogenase subunit G
MRLHNSFTVPAAPDEAWATLLDVPRIAPCMPGASLGEFQDDRFDGTVKVKVGPMTMTYRGNGRFVSRDTAAHRAVIEATGRESRGQGAATATVTAELSPDPAGTRVDVQTDLTISGRAAQFGQSMLTEVSTRLITRFATNLATTMSTPPRPEEPPREQQPPREEQETREEQPPREEQVEAINLLEVTGIGDRTRRAVPYAITFAAGVALTLLVVWLISL